MKINHKELTIATQCPRCKKGNFIDVNMEDYIEWDDGEDTIKAFPYLTAYEREALITGLCPKCCDKVFPRKRA